MVFLMTELEAGHPTVFPTTEIEDRLPGVFPTTEYKYSRILRRETPGSHLIKQLSFPEQCVVRPGETSQMVKLFD